MRAAFGAVVLVAGFLALAGLAGTTTGGVDAGQTLFTTYCASCHGRSGHGDGPVSVDLRVTPSDLTQYAIRNRDVFPAEKVRRIIDGRDLTVRAHGNLEMPIWGDAFKRRQGLTEQAAQARIEAIVVYLQSLQEHRGN
jgi:mono/diheme cytochrome c family protein